MAAYDITQIDIEEFDTVEAQNISMVYLDSTHLAVAYRDSNNDGRIKIYSIDSSYNTITYVSTLVYDTSYGGFNSLVKIDGNHLAVAYHLNSSNDGIIKTFSVDGSYVITEEDSIIFESGEANDISLMLLTSSKLAVAYANATTRGMVVTCGFDSNYDLTLIDSLQHSAIIYGGQQSSLAKIDDTHFALSTGLAIKTFSVDSSADNITEIDDIGLNVYRFGVNTSLVLIDSTHLMVAYQSSSNEDSTIAIYSFDGSYNNITIVSTKVIFSGQGGYYSLVEIDTGLFAVAYKASLLDGYISILTVNGTYGITENSQTEHDTSNGEFNSLVKLDETNFALAYQGVGDDGFIKTFEIETSTEVTPDVITVGVTVQTPTITHYTEVIPDVITVDTTIHAPTVSAGGEILPDTISVITTLHTPTVFTGEEITPDTINITTTIYTPKQIGGLWSSRTKPTTSWGGRTKPTTSWSGRDD